MLLLASLPCLGSAARLVSCGKIIWWPLPFGADKMCSNPNDGQNVGFRARYQESAGLAPIHLCQSPAVLRHLTHYTLAWIDEPDDAGGTILMHASARGHAKVISEALSLGASPSAVDWNSRNALHHAVIAVCSHCCSLLHLDD
jgi:ankyrin repeat protein